MLKTEGRWEHTREEVRVVYRSSKSSPHYKGGEFIDIYINMYCPNCEDGMLETEEDEEILAKCPSCGYVGRVSVYGEE